MFPEVPAAKQSEGRRSFSWHHTRGSIREELPHVRTRGETKSQCTPKAGSKLAPEDKVIRSFFGKPADRSEGLSRASGYVCEAEHCEIESGPWRKARRKNALSKMHDSARQSRGLGRACCQTTGGGTKPRYRAPRPSSCTLSGSFRPSPKIGRPRPEGKIGCIAGSPLPSRALAAGHGERRRREQQPP
jgi:hypothetical protein